MTYILGDLGRSWSFFRDLGSKGKILLGSRGNYFQGSGEINALFSGIKGAQTPPLGGLISRFLVTSWSYSVYNIVALRVSFREKNIYINMSYNYQTTIWESIFAQSTNFW